MVDREKVIEGLVACTGETNDCAGYTCPYWNFDDSVVDNGCRIQMELDALALLKSADPPKGRVMKKMTDREKVIRGLRDMCDFIVDRNGIMQSRAYIHATDDAITLLKKQDAVEPIPYHRSDGTIFKYECRKCMTKIFKNDLFCRHCGQAVKWDA